MTQTVWDSFFTDLLHVTIIQLPITTSRRLLRHLVAREMAKGREARGGRVLLNESVRKWRIALTVHTHTERRRQMKPSISAKLQIRTSKPESETARSLLLASSDRCRPYRMWNTERDRAHTHTRVEIEMGDSCWNGKSRILTAVPSEGDRWGWWWRVKSEACILTVCISSVTAISPFNTILFRDDERWERSWFVVCNSVSHCYIKDHCDFPIVNAKLF